MRIPTRPGLLVPSLLLLLGLAGACGGDDDGGGTAADRIGVGAMCTGSDDCIQGDDGTFTQECLPFKGGYCGLANCQGDADCPYGSACVAHTGGVNYCFRICADKAECNLNRTVDVESNCSSSVDFVDGKKGSKACIPPSSG
jgi:hypothetical protein